MDRYTKFILTVIAFSLFLIALNLSVTGFVLYDLYNEEMETLFSRISLRIDEISSSIDDVVEAIKKRPANTVRTDRAMLRTKLCGDDVNHLSCDYSTALLVVCTLHECILESCITRIFSKIVKSISLDMKVSLDDE